MRVQFPILGLVSGSPSSAQPLQTSPSLQNVRPYDIEEEKIRGGQRAGTVLAYTTQIAGDYPILEMVAVISTYIEPA